MRVLCRNIIFAFAAPEKAVLCNQPGLEVRFVWTHYPVFINIEVHPTERLIWFLTVNPYTPKFTG
jgi:hypothetical protein